MWELFTAWLFQNEEMLTTLGAIGSIVGGIGLSALTVYLTFLQFGSHRIKIVCCVLHSDASGGNAIMLALSNRTMKTFFIRKVDLICDDKYRIPILEGSSYKRELASQSTITLETDSFATLSEPLHIVTDAKQIYAEVFTSDKIIRTKKMRRTPRRTARLEKRQTISHSASHIKPITLHRPVMKDKLVLPSYQYMLHHWFENEPRYSPTYSFIDSDGKLKDSIYITNTKQERITLFEQVPQDLLADREQVRQYLTVHLTDLEIKFELIPLRVVVDEKTGRVQADYLE